MSARAIHFMVPGDLETRTGGYGYDREVIGGLRRRGWHVELVSLPGTYPAPSAADRAAASAALRAIPDGAWVVVDGLAFGVLPDEAARQHARVHFVALVHHPLGLETGLDPDASARLLESERRALASAAGVIVTSRRTVAAVAALGVGPQQIAVVEPGTAAAAVARGTHAGAVHLLCVASLVPRKGYDTLFDALERLADREWHLTAVGSVDRDSAYASALTRWATSGPLAGRITLAGELSGPTLDAAYSDADLFVLPTRYEGYGMAVAEALARGIPVVSTPTGGIAELVGDRAGILVPPDDRQALADALRSLLEDRERLAQLRSGALLVRQSLPTWDAACARLEEALARFGVR